MKNRILLLLLLLVLFAAGAATGAWLWNRSPTDTNHAGHAHAEGKQLYHCPMHPHIVSDAPGQCPICHMDLQPVEPEGHEAAVGGGADASGPSESEISGRTAFSLSGDRQQTIGVTEGRSEFRNLIQEIRATGRVAFDPELYTAIEEYRQARIALSEMKDTPYASLREQSQGLVSSSRTKLKLMGLTEGQIREIGNGRGDPMNLLLPKGRVWIYAEIFEYEAPGVRPGQILEAVAPSLPGQVFKGRIASISPVLNAPTRTVRVRAEVPDPEGQLRPDTYMNVRILNDLGERLAVPEAAVLHSGDQAYVFVFNGETRFEPRRIELGAKAGHFYEVLSGLQNGTRVVTSANFLIDSESRLRSVLMQSQSGKGSSSSGSDAQAPESGAAPPGPGGHSGH